jgi:hypothetical protein
MLYGLLFQSRVPTAGKGLIVQYDALSEDNKDEFLFALINARSRAKAYSDFMSAVAIPIIIGPFFFFDASGETALIVTLAMLCLIVAYAFLYSYYRNTQAFINSCIEVIELKRQ